MYLGDKNIYKQFISLLDEPIHHEKDKLYFEAFFKRRNNPEGALLIIRKIRSLDPLNQKAISLEINIFDEMNHNNTLNDDQRS